MDAEIAALAESARIWRVQECARLVYITMVLWYYVTTLGDEVRYIWPQPNLRLGKILYFATRTAFVLSVVTKILGEFPTHIPLSINVCNALVYTDSAFSRFCFVAAEAALWMCLYALIHGKKKYFIYLVTFFLLYQSTNLSLHFTSMKLEGIHAVERDQLDIEMGYSCTWAWQALQQQTDLLPISRLNTAARYLRLAIAILTLIFAVAVLVMRYRRQNGHVIRIIRREGGLYYFAIISVYLVIAITATPGMQKTDPYGFSHSAQYLSLIFTDRLLLHLRKSNDPGTQAFVSTIVFGKEKGISESESDGWNGTVDTSTREETPYHSSGPESYGEGTQNFTDTSGKSEVQMVEIKGRI